jgi:hypothetical protein
LWRFAGGTTVKILDTFAFVKSLDRLDSYMDPLQRLIRALDPSIYWPLTRETTSDIPDLPKVTLGKPTLVNGKMSGASDRPFHHG